MELTLATILFAMAFVLFTFVVVILVRKQRNPAVIFALDTKASNFRDQFSICNTSSVPVKVNLIGHIKADGSVTKIENFRNLVRNDQVDLPCYVPPHTTLRVGISVAFIPARQKHSYCIETERFGMASMVGNLPVKTALKFKLAEFTSGLMPNNTRSDQQDSVSS